MSKYCVDCGKKNRTNAEECTDCGGTDFYFCCANCGTRFENLPRCPHCGVKAGRAARTCPECGERYFTKACPECGYEKRDIAPSGRNAPTPYRPERQRSSLVCTRCGSDKVNVQISVDREAHSGRGCLWGLGRLFLIAITFGLWLVVGKSKGKTKVKNASFAVCQRCGHQWKVK